MNCCVRRVIIAVLLVFIAMVLAGCQDEQLTNCQQENDKLQQKSVEQEKKIEELSAHNKMLTETVFRMTDEANRLEKELQTAKAKIQELTKENKRLRMSPEEKAKMVKGIEELKRAQKIRAEQLKKNKEEK